MIYWFSGTHNSKYVAETLAGIIGDKCLPMIGTETGVSGEDSVGLVFPVYSWGVPQPVIDFIRRAAIRSPKYLWCVMTYGDEAGMTEAVLRRLLRKEGLALDAVWGIQMPNVYVLLPGFDVDPAEVERRKLDAAPARIAEIAEGIRARARVSDVKTGSWQRLMTRLIYPLFLRWGINPKKFRHTDACIACGKCMRACPNGNIVPDKEGRPRWKNKCCSCLACYHVCPERAVQYGSATRGKGQYHFPLN